MGTQGDGVFSLVSEHYQSNEPEELKAESCEVVWSKIKIKGVQDLYVGAFYKPPSATDPDYLDNLSACPKYQEGHTYGWTETSTLLI